MATAIAAGDFSTAAIRPIQRMLGEMWRSNHAYDQYKKPTQAFACIAENQQVNIDPEFLDATFCEDLELHWLCGKCDDTPVECENSCDWDGEEISSTMEVYTKDPCFETTFKVKRTACKDKFSFVQKMAFSFMQAMAWMDYELNKRMLAFLGGCADELDVLTDCLPFGGISGTSLWQIDKTDFGPELMAHLQLMAEDMFFADPLFITGSIFRADKLIMAAKNGGGCCNSDGLLLNSPIPHCNDTHFFDKIYPKTAGSQQAFLIDRANMAYFNQYRHANNTPIQDNTSDGIFRYHINSPRHNWRAGGSLRPVKYDVYWKEKCDNLDESSIVVKIRHNGGFVKGPDSCEGTPTVIQMEQLCANC